MSRKDELIDEIETKLTYCATTSEYRLGYRDALDLILKDAVEVVSWGGRSTLYATSQCPYDIRTKIDPVRALMIDIQPISRGVEKSRIVDILKHYGKNELADKLEKEGMVE